MSPVELVLSKLPSAQRRGAGWVAKCPAHRDKLPSLKIDVEADGKVLLYCHAHCSIGAVVDAMGLSLKDLMPEDGPDFSPVRAGHVGGSRPSLRVMGNTALKASPEDAPEPKADRPDPKSWPVVKRYPYVDEDGVHLFDVLRKEAPDKSGKVFTQEQPNGVRGLAGIDARPLYRLPAVLTAVEHGTPILLVEGEKDVETAEALGWVATTNVGGASGWREEYVKPLTNADVVLVPDNDEPGRKWAEKVASSLAGFAKRIRIVALPRVEKKGDLSDWVGLGGTSEQLGGMIVKASAWHPGDPIPEPMRPSRFRVYRADELAALPPAAWLVDDCLPTDALAALVGPSGKGKTFLTLGLACAVATGTPWLDRSIGPSGPVLYIAAEGTAGLRARVHAWIAAHHAPADLPVYFICETVNLYENEDVSEVLRAMAALPAPPRLVVVDTLHRAMPGGDENSAKDVGLVITHADQLRRECGCTVLIVHHAKKDADVERGSTALRGACDTMLMLRDEEGVRSLSCEKQKDAADFEAIPLEFTEAHGSVIVTVASADKASEQRMADPLHLKPNERLVLSALEDAGVGGGLTSTEWEKCAGISARSFYRVKAALIRGELVQDGVVRGRFQVSPTGRGALRFAANATAKITAKSLPNGGFSSSPTTGGYGPPKGGLVPSPRVEWDGSGLGSSSPDRGTRSASPSRTRTSTHRGAGQRRPAAPLPPAWILESRPFDEDEVPS